MQGEVRCPPRSADAEGSRNSEIGARPWRERAEIALTTGLSRSTVGEYLRRAAVIGITWPGPEGVDDAELERRLFMPPTFDEKPARPLPDWTDVHKELKRRAVTLLLLWKEYRAEHFEGYGYSRFCDLYRDWCKTISPTMRQAHGAAEKLFVDFAGDTVPNSTRDRDRAARPYLRRGTGSIQLYLRRGALVGRARRPDWGARQRLQRDRRRAEGGGRRQPQGRRHSGLPL